MTFPTHSMRGGALTLLAVIAIDSCASPRSVPAASLPESPAAVTPISTHFTWTPKVAGYSGHYLVTDSSVVTISSDSTSKQLPITTSTVYNLELKQVGSTLITTLATDSFALDTSGISRTVGASRQLTANTDVRGQLSQLRSIGVQSCLRGIDPVLNRVYSLVTTLPRGASTLGAPWTDTLTLEICHGKATFEHQLVRHYTLMSDTVVRSRQAVVVNTAINLIIRNEPADSSHQMTAIGNGSARGVLLLDQRTGQLLEARDSSELNMTITTSRGAFPVHQQLKTHITLQDQR